MENSVVKDTVQLVKKYPLRSFAALVGLTSAALADVHGLPIKENFFHVVTQFLTATLISAEAIDNVIPDGKNYIKNTLNTYKPEKALVKNAYNMALLSGIAYMATMASSFNITDFAFKTSAAGAGLILLQAAANTALKNYAKKKIKESGLPEDEFWNRMNTNKELIKEVNSSNLTNKIYQNRETQIQTVSASKQELK